MIDVVTLIDDVVDYLNEAIAADVTTIADLKREGADRAVINAGLEDHRRAIALVGRLTTLRGFVFDQRSDDDRRKARRAFNFHS